MKKKFLILIICLMLGLVVDVHAGFTCEYQNLSKTNTIKLVTQSDGQVTLIGLGGNSVSSELMSKVKNNTCPSTLIKSGNIIMSATSTGGYTNDLIYSKTGSYSSDDSGYGGGSTGGGNLADWDINGIIGTDACPAIFGSASDPDSLYYIIKEYIFKPVRILVPIVLIVLTSLDFAKVVFNDNKDGMKKAQGNFVKRTVAAIVIFLAPTIVSALLTLIDTAQYNSCARSNNIIDKL